MSTLLALLFSSPIALVVLGGIFASIVANMRGRLTGARLERAKREAEEAKAREIVDDVQSDVGGMSPDQVRAELAKRTRQ